MPCISIAKNIIVAAVAIKLLAVNTLMFNFSHDMIDAYAHTHTFTRIRTTVAYCDCFIAVSLAVASDQNVKMSSGQTFAIYLKYYTIVNSNGYVKLLLLLLFCLLIAAILFSLNPM